MKKYILYPIFLCTLVYSWSQKLERLVTHGTVVDYTHVDANNNLYICGSTKQELTKFNSNNEIEWSVSPWGPSVVDMKTTVTTDTEGNVYWAGDFHMSTDFDLTAEEEIYRPTHMFHTHSFIMKLSPGGIRKWLKIYESLEEGHTNINNIQIDDENKLYVFGTSQKNLSFQHELGNESYNGGFFVSQLDASGAEIWTNYVNNSTLSGHHYYLGTTQNGFKYKEGFLYLTSETGNTGTYTMEGEIKSYSTNGDWDVLSAKIDTLGQWQWINVFGGSKEDKGYGIDVDSEGNVYTTGYFNDIVDFDPSNNLHELEANFWSPMFLHKVNSDGEFQWVKAIQADERPYEYSSSNHYDVTVTDNQTVIVGGEQLNYAIQVFDQDTIYKIYGREGSTIHWIEFREDGSLRSKNRLLNGIQSFEGMNFQNGQLQLWGQSKVSKDFDFSDASINSGDPNETKNAFFISYDLGYTYQTTHACDSIEIAGEWITNPGAYSYNYLDEFGQDSTSTVYLTVGKTVYHEVDVFIASGSDYVYGEWNDIEPNIISDTMTLYSFNQANGCDSIVRYNFIIDSKANGGKTCENASILTDTGYYSVTHQYNEGQIIPSNVYFKFVAPGTGLVKISSLFTSFEDTELYVFDDCNGLQLGYSDDENGGINGYQSEVWIDVVFGDTLLIEWTTEYWDDWYLDHYTFEIRYDGDFIEPNQPVTGLVGVNDAFNIYPNPTSDRIYINEGEGLEYKIYSSHGEEILTSYYKSEGIDLSDFPSGMYFLEFDSQSRKIIKE